MNLFKQEAQNTSATSLPGQLWRQAGGLVLVALAYWVAVRLGLLLVAQPENVASIWPASGLALAVLLLNPKTKWSILLAVLFVTNALANLSGGNSLTVSLGFALANILETYLAAWLFTYLYRSKITFHTTRQMFSLFAAGIFANGLTALLGAAIPALAFGAPFLKTWLVWWSADGLGMILITPLIVTLAASPGIFQPKKPLHAIEGIFLFLVLAVFAWLIFGPYTVAEEPVFRNYMLFPVLIWLAFRFSPRGMAIDMTLVAAIAIWNLLQGNGILAFENQNVTDQLVNLQLFLSVLAFSGFLMSAIVTERMSSEKALGESEEQFRTAFEYSASGMCLTSLDGELMRVNQSMRDMLGYRKGELEGTYLNKITHPDDHSLGIEAIQQMLKGESPSAVIEKRYLKKNGDPVWAHVTSAILHDASGKPLHFITQIEDITRRKQTEQALYSAEEFNKTIIAHSPVGISVRSRHGSLLSANSAWKSIWAIPEEDYQRSLQHQSEKLIFDARDNYLKIRHQEIRRVYEQGGSLFLPDMKTTNPRPGGAEWVSQHFYAILDDKGQVDRVVILTEDISSRKTTEAGITRNQVVLERAQDVAQLGSWEINLANRTVSASAEAHRIYGLEGDSLTLSEIQACVLPEYRLMMDAALRALINEGQEYNVQFKIKRRSDGAVRDIHSRAEYNAADNTVIGSIQDNTERMLILQVVMESEEKFRTLFEHAQDAIHIDNETDDILDANARACELFGYSRDELLGMKVSDLQAPEVRGQEGKTLQAEIDKYGIKIFEGLNQRKDGTKVPVEISVSKISTSQGIRYISIVRDISERKRIERELREQIDTLERFNDVTVGRELKMIELKKEINAMLEEAGKEKKYRIIDV